MNEFNYTNTYSQPSESRQETVPIQEELEQGNKPVLAEGDEIIDMGEDFDFAGFQVVRREFFAHMREPSVTFNDCKFYVNAACLAKFPTSDFAQVLVNRENKILALRPCPEGARDSFQWCSISKGKRKPKPITCRLFFAKVASMMGWEPHHRYKILGKLIHSNDEYLIAFDLTANETYRKTIVEGEKPKTSRVPVFPADWKDQFGLPYNEHKQSMQINIVDGYAVYSIKETSKQSAAEPQSEGVPEAALTLPESNNEGGGYL